MKAGWIGMDLDSTLADSRFPGPDGIGQPIPAMVALLQSYLAQGYEVRIFTARAVWPIQKPVIQAWCKRNLGVVLPITNVKTPEMLLLYDDRAIGVIPNTGQLRCGGESFTRS